MNWGENLWDNLNDIEKYIYDQNEFYEIITMYIKESSKIYNTYQKSLNKLNKSTLDTLNKRKKADTNESSLMEFIRKMISHFDMANKSYREMYEGILDLLIELSKNMTELNNENRKTVNDIEKARKTLTSLKTHAESARKSLLSKKLERDTLNKSIDLVDKNEVQKYRKMQNELREKSKTIEKASVTYDKAKKKLLEYSPNYYQNTLYNGLNNLQDTELSKANLISSSLDKYLGIYANTIRTTTTCSDNCISDYSSVNVTNDMMKFEETYKNQLPLPKTETLEGDSLEDIGKLDHEVDFKVINCGSRTSLRTASVRKLTKTESYNNAVKCLETSQQALNEAIKEKDALDKMVTSCSQFGGFSESLHSQMMTIIGEVEKLEIQVKYYEELVGKYHQNHTITEGSPGQYLIFSSDDNIKENDDKSNGTMSIRKDSVEIVKNANVVISNRINTNNEKESTINSDKQPRDNSITSSNVQTKDDSQPQQEGLVTYKVMKYDFEGNESGALTVFAGDKINIIEVDDGSGWTFVSKLNDSTVEGYVPTDYIE